MLDTPGVSGDQRATADAPNTGFRGRFLYAIVSLLIGIPCIWQQHVQACDLSSHLYNAWLVNQVSAGNLPGLYVVPQFTNVLFDHLLSFLMKSESVVTAERLAVLLAVQVFFWGCFILASAMAGRPAWSIAPFLAIAAYGAVFRMGFFNFYLSVGICACAIALVWQTHARLRLLAIPLLALAYTAHSIACLWAIGVIAYMWVARLQPSRRSWLAAIALMCIVGSALFLARNVPSRWVHGLRIDSMLGADQILTYGMKYTLLEAALLCLWILLLVRRSEMTHSMSVDIPFQLLLLNAVVALCMPDAIWFPHYHVRLTFIAIRLSLLSAILLCGVIARVRLSTVEKATTYALLVLFFGFTYVDERAINSIERKMVQAIASLPPGARVVATVRDARLFVPALQHLVDRACIGRCFDFADYEPPTAQFRLRAMLGNPYVMTSVDDVLALENSGYVWLRRDIQLYRLQPCPASSDICVSVVPPGERLAEQQLDSVPKWLHWSDRP
jgi:hypothetical protein